jgi:hypothetical protein
MDEYLEKHFKKEFEITARFTSGKLMYRFIAESDYRSNRQIRPSLFILINTSAMQSNNTRHSSQSLSGRNVLRCNQEKI